MSKRTFNQLVYMVNLKLEHLCQIGVVSIQLLNRFSIQNKCCSIHFNIPTKHHNYIYHDTLTRKHLIFSFPNQSLDRIHIVYLFHQVYIIHEFTRISHVTQYSPQQPQTCTKSKTIHGSKWSVLRTLYILILLAQSLKLRTYSIDMRKDNIKWPTTNSAHKQVNNQKTYIRQTRINM